MPAGKPGDFRKRVVDPLGIEGPATLEEGVLVAKIAVLRAAAGDDDGIWNQVVPARDQIAADRRHALEGAARGRLVDFARQAGAELQQKPRKSLLRRPEKDGIGIHFVLPRKRSHV